MSKKMSRHEQAKVYKEKERLLGVEVLKIELLDNDRVKLIEVLDKNSDGKIVIPKFITNYQSYDLWGGVFRGCHYTDLYIDNEGMIDIGYLCANMESKEIRIRFKNSNLIKNMNSMFNKCRNLENVDLGNIDTSNVTDMGSMFSGCIKLKSIDISKWDVSKVKDLIAIFKGCSNLYSINMGSIDTSNIRNMAMLFDGCTNLINIDLSKLIMHNVKDVSKMFNGCSNIIELDLSNLNMGVRGSNVFDGCYKLRELKVSCSGGLGSILDTNGEFNKVYGWTVEKLCDNGRVIYKYSKGSE